MKKVFFALLLLVVAILGLSGSAYAAGGPTKNVEIAGSGGLDVAARECRHLLGQHAWQACVAHHDGLYTPAADGSINRNFERTLDATKPNQDGPVTCVAEFVKMDNGDIGWAFPPNAICKVNRPKK